MNTVNLKNTSKRYYSTLPKNPYTNPSKGNLKPNVGKLGVSRIHQCFIKREGHNKLLRHVSFKSNSRLYNQIACATKVVFPKFVGPKSNCNMLPFIIGNSQSIPTKFRRYYPLIEACKIPFEEMGKIGFLSIHESIVKKGESQRRPGI